jgi:hypothetical protein
VVGYDPNANKAFDLIATLGARSTTGALSIGEGTATTLSVSRQITNVSAGTRDWDAVNVLQLKRLRQYVDSKAGGLVGAGKDWPSGDMDADPSAIPSGCYRTVSGTANKPGDARGVVLWQPNDTASSIGGALVYTTLHPVPMLYLRQWNGVTGTWGEWGLQARVENNLSDLPDKAAARANLGLSDFGSIAA